MTCRVLVLIAGLVCSPAAITFIAAQRGVPHPPPAEAPQAVDLTLTGCVVEGTDTGVYILANAVATPETPDVPRTFRLVSGGEDLDFTLHANHQVQAMGRAELKTVPEPPVGGRIDPRDLPAFAVKSIRSVSDRCVSRPGIPAAVRK